MHDIDAQINKISGQSNYMEQLSKVTGDIFTVDKEKYKEVLKSCSPCDFCIAQIVNFLLSSKDLNSEGRKLFENFLQEQALYDIGKKTFEVTNKKKKGKVITKEVVDYKHLPKNVVSSKWFSLVKDIEKSSRKFLKQFPNETYVEYSEHLKSVPELYDIASYYGVQVHDEKTFNNVKNLQKCGKTIINGFVDPMYDVEGTIRKNYHLIQRIFKTSPKELKDHITSTEDIINILTKFIIAKYRATITNNNKHYVKLFMNIIDDSSSTEIDGAKFMEIMESINLEQLNKNDKVYKFALGAKTTINNIFTNDKMDAEDIIKNIQDIFDSTQEKTEETIVEDTTAAKYDGLL